jgi:competence protein ComEA
MNTSWALMFGLVGGLCGAGLLWLIASPPRGVPVTLQPPPTPPPILIHVKGAVHNPGVYTLDPDSRVVDALAAAGGLLPDGDGRQVNLAARSSDGDQLNIPTKRSTPEAGAPFVGPGQPIYGGSSDQQRVGLNTAPQAELETLPGIGPATAAKIIDYRNTKSPLLSPEDLQKVSGIGPATYHRLADLITFSDIP